MTKIQQKPPRWIKKIFDWYCGAEVAEDLIGDVEELYYSNSKKMSARKANTKYLLQCIVLLFSYAVRQRRRTMKKQHLSYQSSDMLQSYLKIAIRSIAKQRVFAVINVICLAVGMSVGLIALAAWVDVLQVDNFHTRKDNIYRVTTLVDDQSQKQHFASSHFNLNDKLRHEAANVNEVVSVNNTFHSEVVFSPAVTIPFDHGYYVSKNFLKVFDFPLIAGDATSALSRPFTILISEKLARKLYRDGEALGKTLQIKDIGTFEITGVVGTHPRSHFLFEALTSTETLAILEQEQKVAKTLFETAPISNNYTYVWLDEESADRLEPILKEAAAHLTSKQTNMTIDYQLQSLTNIPLSELNNEVGLSWGYLSMMIFFFLSMLVLLPACFNYANISVARALKRSKEIGLRKVSGGEKKHIFLQMIMETIVISIIALIGAVLIFSAVRTHFLQMIVNGEETFSLELSPVTFSVFLLFAILTGIIAGILPATYFSKLNPIETLRNSSASGKISKISIRKGLIVAQFALSLVFILGVAIIFKQYKYALNFDLGFEKENILDLQLKGVNEEVLKNQLQTLKDVKSVSMSSSIAGNWGSSLTYVKTQNGRDSLALYQMFVDEDYIANLEIELLAGRSFADGEMASVVVNEAFLRKHNFLSPHDALGKTFECEDQLFTISGVVKDFNFMPLAEQIQPFMLRQRAGSYRFANIKLQSTDIEKSLAAIEAVWYRVTEQKFEARFLKHELDDSLKSFRSLVKIFGFLGLLAITISALGLLAVVISSAESRLREMGIRKVFGASDRNIVASLASGFIKLILIAIVIATPLTYFMFENFFLNMFFYRASIGIGEIAVGIAFLLILVAIIIGSQSLRVTRINPVEILKYE